MAISGQITKKNDSVLFTYSGDVQTYTIPMNGLYKLEVNGASGGDQIYDIAGQDKHLGTGGKGGYSVGYSYFSKGQELYICIGKCGENHLASKDMSGYFAKGGYNGGGNGGLSGGGGGGGCTSITQFHNRGELYNYKDFIHEILIVAGGGGGGVCERAEELDTELDLHGGSGGGLVGGNGNENIDVGIDVGYGGGWGGRQYPYDDNGEWTDGWGYFGLAENTGDTPGKPYGGGGGGGYYGGGDNQQGAGGGGSGYIGGVPEISFQNTRYTPSTLNGRHSGDGDATITFLGSSVPTMYLGHQKVINLFYGNIDITNMYLGSRRID